MRIFHNAQQGKLYNFVNAVGPELTQWKSGDFSTTDRVCAQLNTRNYSEREVILKRYMQNSTENMSYQIFGQREQWGSRG